jgi:hypothetical protein
MEKARLVWDRKRCMATAVLALAGLAGRAASAPAHAAGQGVQGQMRISATVLRHTSVRLDAPQQLTISESDLARGYVDASKAVEVAVQSNVRDGYTLVLHQDGKHVREAVVQGPAGALVVGTGGGMLARPAAGSGMWHDTMQLRVRFKLSAQAQVGTYDWPLQISVISE